MSSATLTPYSDNSTQVTYLLASESQDGASWLVSGRSIGQPHKLTLTRKLSPGNSGSNDHVKLVASVTNTNSDTGKLATGSVMLDISIPKDSESVSRTDMTKLLGEIASLLNESTALESTSVTRTALLEGRSI